MPSPYAPTTTRHFRPSVNIPQQKRLVIHAPTALVPSRTTDFFRRSLETAYQPPAYVQHQEIYFHFHCSSPSTIYNLLVGSQYSPYLHDFGKAFDPLRPPLPLVTSCSRSLIFPSHTKIYIGTHLILIRLRWCSVTLLIHWCRFLQPSTLNQYPYRKCHAHSISRLVALNICLFPEARPQNITRYLHASCPSSRSTFLRLLGYILFSFIPDSLEHYSRCFLCGRGVNLHIYIRPLVLSFKSFLSVFIFELCQTW